MTDKMLKSVLSMPLDIAMSDHISRLQFHARAQAALERITELEGIVKSLLTDVVPHVRDTGHNAADRELKEAIRAAHAAVGN